MELINYLESPEKIYDRVEAQIEMNLSQVEALKALENPTFDSFVLPLEKDEAILSDIYSLASHLQAVKNKEEVRQRHQKVQQQLAAYSSKIGFDKKLMEQFEKIDQLDLSVDQKTVVTHALDNFKLSGVGLAQEQKDKLFSYRQELSALTTKFSENILDSTDSWLIDVEEKDLTGLDQEQLSYFKNLAQEHQRDSKYTIGLDGPSYQIVMNYCENRPLREKLYKAYSTRSSPNDPTDSKFDNSDVTTKIVSVRDKIAKILGYQNYLECSLAKKFAQQPEDVSLFLNNLIQKVRPKALQEIKHLEQFAQEMSENSFSLEPWDVGFYAQKLKKKTLDFNEQELKVYFPLDHVQQQMFELFGNLYGFSVLERPDVTVWHEDAKAFELVSKETKESIGFLMADFFARPKKRSGAWMSDAQSYVQYNDWEQKPIAHLICNFQKAEKPTLTFRDVETLFHEFGHALHHLLTTRSLPSIAGINEVSWDIVELPSQLNEQWCYQPEILKKLSKHLETQEPLSDELIEKVIQSRHFHASLHLIRQLEFAQFDWKIHALCQCDDAVSFWKEMREDINVTPSYEHNSFPLGFSHIFAGGYAAGYYSYLWAEAYCHQVFDHFKKHEFSKDVTEGFKKHFLSQGGDLNLKENLHQYLDKEQDLTPLLEAYAID